MCAGVTAPLFADDTNVLTDEKSRVSYAIGMSIGSSWKMHGVEVDDTLFMKGLNDALSGGAPLMSRQEISLTLNQYQKTLMAKQQAMQAEAGIKAKAEGEAFLATNKNNPGVITLADGLQYKVLTTGNGPTPTANDTVTVNYAGTFINGQEFDSSAKAGHPVQFPVTQVIHGWTEALQLMTVGSKWRLYVPASLAYGVQGHPPVIPPNSALIFDVELLAAEAPRPRATMPPPPQSPPLTSDIIKVPSAEELKKGAKIETIKPEDIQKYEAQATNSASTNTAAAH